MKISCIANTEKGFIEKSVSLENLPDGTFELVARTIPTGGKKEQEMRMAFTKQGYQALIGSWLAFEQKGNADESL